MIGVQQIQIQLDFTKLIFQIWHPAGYFLIWTNLQLLIRPHL